MHALRMDCACTAVAFLVPTFGKRPQDQGGASRKRAAATSDATEQVEVAAMTLTTGPNDDEGHAATEHVSPEFGMDPSITQSTAPLPLINSLDDVVEIFGPLAGEGDAYLALHRGAQQLQNGNKQQIRDLCKPWGVIPKAKNAQGTWGHRSIADLKQDIQEKVIERARDCLLYTSDAADE